MVLVRWVAVEEGTRMSGNCNAESYCSCSPLLDAARRCSRVLALASILSRSVFWERLLF